MNPTSLLERSMVKKNLSLSFQGLHVLLLYSKQQLCSSVSPTPDHQVFIISPSKRLLAITKMDRLIITDTVNHLLPFIYISYLLHFLRSHSSVANTPQSSLLPLSLDFRNKPKWYLWKLFRQPLDPSSHLQVPGFLSQPISSTKTTSSLLAQMLMVNFKTRKWSVTRRQGMQTLSFSQTM